MRIISKWHDYYDGLQNHEDRDLLYVRHAAFIEKGSKHYSVFRDVPSAGEALQLIRPIGDKWLWLTEDQQKQQLSTHKYGDYRRVILLFCGKVYTGVAYQETSWRGIWQPMSASAKTVVYWDAEALFKEHYLKEGKYTTRHERLLASLLFRSDDKLYLDACMDTGAPVIGVCYDDRDPQVPWKACMNPDLREFQFYRVFEAYQAFQELSMFLGGVMASTDLPEPATNKVKIEAHGFDYVDSFRKGPTKEHR